MNRNGSLLVQDDGGREKERYSVAYGALLKVKEGQKIKPGQKLVEWDPYSFAILTEFGGTVAFKDIHDGVTVKEEVDENTGLSRQVITESPDEKYQPQIQIKNEKGKVVKSYLLPSKAHLLVDDGEEVFPGDILAKIPRETRRPRISPEVCRASSSFSKRASRRRPPSSRKSTAWSNTAASCAASARSKCRTRAAIGEYLLPRGVHINVQEGEYVRAGEALMDGPRNPHDILRVLGEKELQSYLVNEIQEVYRLQGVNINDKHIEVIVRQMMRWIKVEEVGDTEFLLEEQVDKFRFYEENERVKTEGGRAGQRASVAARNHQGLSVHRQLHLRGILPGDDARADRSRHQRQGRLPARPEGKRDHGSAHSGRNRHGVLPEHRSGERVGGYGTRRRASGF